MELKILTDNENKLMNRREITFRVTQEGSTANRTELTKELCKRLNLHPDCTIVVKIYQGYGIKEGSGLAHSYKTKEMLEKYEKKSILARIARKSAKKQAEKQTESKDEEITKTEEK